MLFSSLFRFLFFVFWKDFSVFETWSWRLKLKIEVLLKRFFFTFAELSNWQIRIDQLRPTYTVHHSKKFSKSGSLAVPLNKVSPWNSVGNNISLSTTFALIVLVSSKSFSFEFTIFGIPVNQLNGFFFLSISCASSSSSVNSLSLSFFSRARRLLATELL